MWLLWLSYFTANTSCSISEYLSEWYITCLNGILPLCPATTTLYKNGKLNWDVIEVQMGSLLILCTHTLLLLVSLCYNLKLWPLQPHVVISSGGLMSFLKQFSCTENIAYQSLDRCTSCVVPLIELKHSQCILPMMPSLQSRKCFHCKKHTILCLEFLRF